MSSAVATPAPRRVTREEIVRLGQTGRAWEFLPIAYQAVGVAPEDWGLRVLLAANLARLGLKTLAAEQMAMLPEGVAGNPEVRGLAALIGGMREDRIGRERLIETCRKNLVALAARGLDLEHEFLTWAEDANRATWFRATDGNVVRRTGAAWAGLGDYRGTASKIASEQVARAAASADGFVIEGVDPPWLLQEVARVAARDKTGFWPRLMIVQADVMEFLNGLAHTDLRSLLGEERTEAFIGAEATRRLGDTMAARLDRKFVGLMLTAPGLKTRCEPSVAGVLHGVDSRRNGEHERLAARAATLYAGRDAAWWAARFASAGAGGPPLRVLIPSCRYTTYVQHSARDLAAAFTKAGCEARLLIEPDDSSRFSSLSYLGPLCEWQPDLVVLINYTRRNIGEWIPGNVPLVCWIQDAMPHQFNQALGERQTRFDFLAGHVYEELVRRFGFPRERSMHVPVVASCDKFHAEPVDAGLRRRMECEIALVSHHSETPELMHDRLVNEAGRGSLLHQVIDEVRPKVLELAQDPLKGPVHATLEKAAREAIRKHSGREPDARVLTLVHKSYCLPMADRVLRHQTLAWAAELAEERGWRLHVYGRGWESHPRFAAFARGELAHGEELRAAYQAASVHLHASINTLAHQRVMECALSGGLPLCRLIFEVLRPAQVAATRAALLRVDPTVCDPETRRHGYFISDHPECAGFTGLCQRLGRPTEPFWWVEDKFLAAFRNDRSALQDALADPSAWLLGDFGETSFACKERLGELLARALASPSWRAGWSAAIAGRVRERFTHDRLAERIRRLVADSFLETETTR